MDILENFSNKSSNSLYYKRNYDEAKKCGIEIKYENLIMVFDSTSENLCGKCSNQPLQGQRITRIKKDFLCWKGVPNQNKEALVFMNWVIVY